MNKASGDDRNPAELFQIPRDDRVKVLHSMSVNLENSNGHKTGKGQLSFHLQRKVMSKNVQTTAQLHSSHTLAK